MTATLWRMVALSTMLALAACTDDPGDNSEDGGQDGSDGAVDAEADGSSAHDDDAAVDDTGTDTSPDTGLPEEGGAMDADVAGDGGIQSDGSMDAEGDSGSQDDTGSPNDTGAQGDSGVQGDSGSSADARTPGDPDSGIDWWTPLPCGRLGSVAGTSNAVIDVGHARTIDFMAKSNERLLAIDGRPNEESLDTNHRTGEWVLWNTVSRTVVARGATTVLNHFEKIPPAALVAADRFVTASLMSGRNSVRTYRFELRSMQTGQLITSVTEERDNLLLGSYGIAADGSYLWAAMGSGIKAWNASGAVILEKDRNYHELAKMRHIFAAPGELLIAGASGMINEPMGFDQLQRISTATGTATTSQFSGEFHDWFDDGSAFFTTVGSTVRIYRTNPTQQQAIFALASDLLAGKWGGRGAHFWFRTTRIEIRALANPSATLFQSSGTVPVGGVAIEGETLGMLPAAQPPVLERVRFAEAGQPTTTTPLPRYPRANALLALGASGTWAIGDSTGGIYDSADTSAPLSCGAPLSLTGSETGRAVVVTGAGGAFMFELTPTSRQYVGRVPFSPTAVHAEISRDGSTLLLGTAPAYVKPSDTFTVSALTLPDFAMIQTWSPDLGTATERGFTVTENGQRFAIRSAGRYSIFERGNGTASFTLPSSTPVLHFSPSGARQALLMSSGLPALATDIYQDGVLVGAAACRPLGWLDEDRMLVMTSGAKIYDYQGSELADLVWWITPNYMYRVTSNSFYVANGTSSGIYSASTGLALWDGPEASIGTIAGPYVVYVGSPPNEVRITAY